jgi:hypothetical protein
VEAGGKGGRDWWAEFDAVSRAKETSTGSGDYSYHLKVGTKGRLVVEAPGVNPGLTRDTAASALPQAIRCETRSSP